MEMLNLCTLFDVNYMDRGLALYYSLRNCCEDFRLYIIAFDGECYNILNKLELNNAVIISLDEMENEVLRQVKKTRSYRAYCWTCSAWSIKYCMDTFDLDMCTYVDADEYFYSDPTELIGDFYASGSSVGIIEHHFGRRMYGDKMARGAGRFCVQFNSFKNDACGMRILNDWCIQCAECCDEFSNGKTFGDQKYLEDWPEKYEKVYVYSQLGAGIAPWNIYRYKRIKGISEQSYVYDKVTKEKIKVYFMHFHNLKIGEKHIDINVFTRFGIHDKVLIKHLYYDYLDVIFNIRRHLKHIMEESIGNVSRENNVIVKKNFIKKVREQGVLLMFVGSVKFRLCKKRDFVENEYMKSRSLGEKTLIRISEKRIN